MTGSHRTRRRTRSSALVRCREVLLTLGAVIGTVCLLLTVAGFAFDVRALVFRSGSMEPEISTGALAFARTTPASELEVGDVVSVLSSNGTRVTHRIASIDDTGRTTRLTLKGDANRRADAEPYDVESADRVIADVPYIGYAIGYAATPVGIFAGGLLAGGLLWLVVRPSPSRPDHGQQSGRRRAGAAGAVAVIAATSVVAQAPVSTLAYFNDPAAVESAPLVTYKVPTTTMTCQAVNGIQIKLTWAAVPGATSYTLTSGAITATVTAPTTTYTFTPLVAAGTAVVAANRAFGSPVTTTWTSAASNVVPFSAVVVTACT